MERVSWINKLNDLGMSLSQVQDDGQSFDAVVDVGIYDGTDPVPVIHPLPLTAAGGALSIPVPGRPAAVVLDPRTTLLARWTFAERQP